MTQAGRRAAPYERGQSAATRRNRAVRRVVEVGVAGDMAGRVGRPARRPSAWRSHLGSSRGNCLSSSLLECQCRGETCSRQKLRKTQSTWSVIRGLEGEFRWRRARATSTVAQVLAIVLISSDNEQTKNRPTTGPRSSKPRDDHTRSKGPNAHLETRERQNIPTAELPVQILRQAAITRACRARTWRRNRNTESSPQPPA